MLHPAPASTGAGFFSLACSLCCDRRTQTAATAATLPRLHWMRQRTILARV